MSDAVPTTPAGTPAPRSWQLPRITELPKLTKLTLASAIGGGGGTGGGGSTVFGLLVTAGLLALGACTSDTMSGPNETALPPVMAAITCNADVQARRVTCGADAPQSSLSYEILGEGGRAVALRSTNILYDGGLEQFSFDVTVQNLGAQSLGTVDGVTPGQINVFFDADPVVTTGSGTITIANATGTGTFTAAGQSYYGWTGPLANGATSTTLNWLFNVPASVNTFTFKVLVAAEVPTYGGILRWEPVFPSSADLSSLVDIAANGPDDAMAVGSTGLVLHKGAGGWEVVPVQQPSGWVNVEAIGSGRYMALAGDATVWLYQNRVWRFVTDYTTGAAAFTALSATDYAVGGTDRVEWSAACCGSVGFPSSGGTPFRMAATYNGGNSWFVASTSGFKAWGDFASGTYSGTGGPPLTALAAHGTDHVLAASWTGTMSLILDQSDNSVPYFGPDSIIDALVYADGGVPGAYLWRASRSATSGLTALVSRDAGSGVWTTRAVVGDTVRALVDDQNGGLYYLTPTAIKRWDGVVVVDEYVGSPVTLGKVSGTEESAIFSAGGSQVYQYDGTSWNLRDAGVGTVNAVFSRGPDDQYAGGSSGGISHWDGATWTVQRAAGSGTIEQISGVTGLTVAVGGTAIYLDDGGGWNQVSDPDVNADSMQTVYVASTNAVWVGAKFVRMYRYDGADWTKDFSLSPQGGTVMLAGTSASDVWVAHKDSVLHWNGSGWSGDIAPPGAGSVGGIGAASPNRLAVSFATAGAVQLDVTGNAVPLNAIGSGAPNRFGGSGPEGLWAVANLNEVWRSRR